MKLHNCVLTSILVALLIRPIESLIVNTEGEIICSPKNPTDCYPKIFEPTEEWQNIREGQDIPPGLHVRLNIDTLTREAKLMDPSEEEDSKGLIMNPEHNDKTQDDNDMVNDIQEKIKQFKQGGGKSKVSKADLSDFQSSIEEIQQFHAGSDTERLSRALDTVVELSHDIEFGVKLTHDPSIFTSLVHDSQLVEDFSIEEKIYRIMGSTLRNNPEAVTNVLNNQNAEFVDDLLGKLKSDKPDVIKKRILGVIHALTQDRHFNAKYFNVQHPNSGVNTLISVFPSLEAPSQARLMNIFDDLELLGPNTSNEKRAVEDTADPQIQYSSFLQDHLSNSKVASQEQLKLFFTKLSEIHSQNKSLKPSKGFMEWLAKEAESRTKGNQERDVSHSEEDKQFNQELLRARHVVFGNPMGLRKAMADEL